MQQGEVEMNYLDIVILVVAGGFAVRGLIRGVLMEVFTLVGLLIGYLVALRQMSVVTALLENWLNLKPPITGIIGFILIFGIIITAFRLIGGLLKKFMKWTFLGWLDRGLGALFGLFKGVLICSLVIMLIGMIPWPGAFEDNQESSLLYNPVRGVAPAVFNVIKHVFPKTKDFYEEVREGVSEKSDEIKEDMIRRQVESLKEDIKSDVPED